MADLFNVVNENGYYRIGYLVDGWTMEFNCKAETPGEAMLLTQNYFGDILKVTYVEKM